MTAAGTPVLSCRACGRPRGENIAHGTRCADCGKRRAIMLWLAGSLAAGTNTLYAGADVSAAMVAVVITLVILPGTVVAVVLIHELLHAGTAIMLGQTVTRIVVGEGRVMLRIGRDPQLVIGSVVIGNGLTYMLDLRERGYRVRAIIATLAAPAGSALLGMSAWRISTGWPMAPRTAVLVFAVVNLCIALLTLLPFPRSGAGVWSDLAMALSLARASRPELRERMLLCAQDRIAMLVETGEIERAIETARKATSAFPASPLASSLLAYALWYADRRHEAAAVARQALTGDLDDVSRAYLTRFI